MCSLKQVKKTQFDKVMIRLTNLNSLNFVGFNMISESALARIVDGSRSSLKEFKISYRNIAIGNQLSISLCRC
jgi:hypothetical protein